jgi:hypothetical protein
VVIDDEQPERGICTYSVWYVVNTNTSGNELRGPSVPFGKYASQQSAKLALVESPRNFTNEQCGWRSADGYTTAAISRVVYYDDYEVTNG